MFVAEAYPISIAELRSFSRDASKIMSEEEKGDMINYLARNPDSGDVIPGTGGIRKIRWPAKSQGKRSGARVIYYFRDLNMPLYLLAVYAKNEKLDLTAGEKKMMADAVSEIVSGHSARWLRIVKGDAS